MKLPLLLALCGALALPTFAQDAPKNGDQTPVAAGKLLLPFDVLRQPPTPDYLHMLDEAPRIAAEFVRQSQIKASQSDWIGAMTARLDALELGVNLESKARSANNAGFFAHDIETVAMKEIYTLAAHINGAASQAVASRLDAIEAKRPAWIDLLETNRAENLWRVEPYLQNPDWKERIIRESVVEHDGGELGSVSWGIDPKQLQDASASMLQSQVEKWWDNCLQNERQPVGTTRIGLGFELHEAAVFLLEAPDSNDRMSFFMAHTQALLFSCALKLKAIHEETGAYPTTFNTPTDPFSDGKPLIYWPVGKTYRLYSVGPDGKDDGAKTALSRFQARWPNDVIPPLLEPQFETSAR